MQVVNDINYSGDKVVITASSGEDYVQYEADYALVTFGLGVLQKDEVTFTPRLPEWKTEQIYRYQRGTIEGILLKFASKFWSDAEWVIHASDLDFPHYPSFLNLDRDGFHPGSNILVAFITGEEAIRVADLSDEAVAEEVTSLYNLQLI